MTWVDRIVAAFAPENALRRAQARAALRFVENAERRGDFDRNTGRVADARPERVVARERVRRLIQTNAYARKALEALMNNLVGYGITGTPPKGVPQKVVKEWKRWIARADFHGRLDLYGLQSQSVQTMLADGECFIVRRFQAGGGLIPTRIELLDGGALAEWKGKNGIERDAHGRPTAYWFRKRDANGLLAFNDAEKLSASEVIHLFKQDWPGQERGRSIFEAAIRRLDDLDAYFEAETVRKQIEACFAAFISPSLDSEASDNFGQDGGQTAAGNDIETLEPGMITRLRPGDSVSFGTPRPTVGMLEFARVSLMGSAAAVGITYEHQSGDLSNVNYSSYKAGSLEFQRFCGRLQWLLIIPTMLERIWQWFLDDGYQVGLFARTDYPIDWMPAAFESIDLAKDVSGQVALMSAGLASRRQLVAARGYDHDEQLAEIKADLAAQGELRFQGDPTSAAAAAPAEPN